MMGGSRKISERDLDRLLAGQASLDGSRPDALAAVVRHLRAAYPKTPVPRRVEKGHIAAMIAVAELSATGCGEVWARRARPPKRARPARLALKVVLASALLVLLLCGMALAGALPTPMRDLAQRAASVVGVKVAPSGPKATGPATGALASPSATPDPSPATRSEASAAPVTAHGATADEERDEDDARTRNDAQEAESEDQDEEQTATTPDDRDDTEDVAQEAEAEERPDEPQEDEEGPPPDAPDSND